MERLHIAVRQRALSSVAATKGGGSCSVIASDARTARNRECRLRLQPAGAQTFGRATRLARARITQFVAFPQSLRLMRRAHGTACVYVGGVHHVATVAVRRKATGEWAAYDKLYPSRRSAMAGLASDP